VEELLMKEEDYIPKPVHGAGGSRNEEEKGLHHTRPRDRNGKPCTEALHISTDIGISAIGPTVPSRVVETTAHDIYYFP